MGLCSSFRSLLDNVMEALGMRQDEDEGRRGSRMQAAQNLRLAGISSFTPGHYFLGHRVSLHYDWTSCIFEFEPV